MTSSLVGSEMCIRDSTTTTLPSGTSLWRTQWQWRQRPLSFPRRLAAAVSYTHLTLPTICSV
eukprot:12539217-Prorocentrum_lima.AAC.1